MKTATVFKMCRHRVNVVLEAKLFISNGDELLKFYPLDTTTVQLMIRSRGGGGGVIDCERGSTWIWTLTKGPICMTEFFEGHFTQKIFVHPVQNPRKSGKFWQKIQKSGQQFPNPKIQKSTENVKYMELSLFHLLL